MTTNPASSGHFGLIFLKHVDRCLAHRKCHKGFYWLKNYLLSNLEGPSYVLGIDSLWQLKKWPRRFWFSLVCISEEAKAHGICSSHAMGSEKSWDAVPSRWPWLDGLSTESRHLLLGFWCSHPGEITVLSLSFWTSSWKTSPHLLDSCAFRQLS